MATTNNPENQNSKPHGLGDQVQISTNHAEPRINPHRGRDKRNRRSDFVT